MRGTPHRLRNPCLFATLAVALACLAPASRSEMAASPERSALDVLAFPPESQIEPLTWAALEGWQEDDHAAAFAAFQSSCKPLVTWAKWRRHRHQTKSAPRPMRVALAEVCAQALHTAPADDAAARAFFEDNFRPLQVSKLGEETGLLTGYYEPVIEGSRFPSDEYVVPVYARPPNLIALGRRHAADGSFPNKGPVGRRVDSNKIVPYHDRAEIEDGVLAGHGLEICWVKDPVDAFFMQIQGSARVKLDTGKTLRLNYAAHNGYPYTPVGRILIERDEVRKAEMSMDRIREWMEKNPDQGKALRRENRSYVFMRETGLADDVEPTGAQGVALTPRRSIAVDKALHVYGTPFFISAQLPIESAAPVTPFRHLMVAQDTGSAIVGVARADIYFGAGDDAGRIGGRIKQQGRFVMLVPKAIDISVDAAKVPVPIARPPQPDDPIVVPASPTFVSAPGSAAPAAGRAMAYARAAAAVPVPVPTVASRQIVSVVPMPIPRPSAPPQKPTRAPDWLVSMISISRAEAGPLAVHQVRSFASAESAIMAAASAPAAFAAPAITQAAATLLPRTARVRTVPLPKPRPRGVVPLHQ